MLNLCSNYIQVNSSQSSSLVLSLFKKLKEDILYLDTLEQTRPNYLYLDLRLQFIKDYFITKMLESSGTSSDLKDRIITLTNLTCIENYFMRILRLEFLHNFNPFNYDRAIKLAEAVFEEKKGSLCGEQLASVYNQDFLKAAAPVHRAPVHRAPVHSSRPIECSDESATASILASRKADLSSTVKSVNKWLTDNPGATKPQDAIDTLSKRLEDFAQFQTNDKEYKLTLAYFYYALASLHQRSGDYSAALTNAQSCLKLREQFQEDSAKIDVAKGKIASIQLEQTSASPSTRCRV